MLDDVGMFLSTDMNQGTSRATLILELYILDMYSAFIRLTMMPRHAKVLISKNHHDENQSFFRAGAQIDPLSVLRQ